MNENFDVVVCGGGIAGLSGATTLARSRRSVLVVDDGSPRNAPSDGVHNYPGLDGTPPADLLRLARAEVVGYGGTVRAGRVTGAQAVDGGFDVHLADGTAVTARRLLLATGLADELPAVAGLAERWGRDVLHCPFCHGWEVRDQRIAVLATGPAAVHQAQLFRQLTADVTVLAHTAGAPEGEAGAGLAARGIAVVEGEVVALEVRDDRLTGARLADGTVVPCDALVVGPRFTARSAVAAALGLASEELRMGEHVMGDAVPAAPGGRTAVPGVWVAGNLTDLRAGVVNAAGQGFTAATEVHADLLHEDVQRAVAAKEAVGV